MEHVRVRDDGFSSFAEQVRDLSSHLSDILPAARGGDIAEIRELVRYCREKLDRIAHACPVDGMAEMEAKRASRLAETERQSEIALESVGHAFTPKGFFVYFLWEHPLDDRPLYIGQSKNVLSRLGDHVRDPEKFVRVNRVTLIRCQSSNEMCRTEARLIGWFKPEWNVTFAGGPADMRYARNRPKQAV